MEIFTNRVSKLDIDRFYFLSSLMGDDLYKVAFLVYSCYPEQSQRSFYYILRDLEALKLQRYTQQFNELLAETKESLITKANGMTFKSNKGYIQYLSELLKLNNINFVPFVQAIETKSSIYNSIAIIYEEFNDES